jgi:ribosomal-protein-alanine N-acetyltransferase
MFTTQRCTIKKLTQDDWDFYKQLKTSTPVRKYLWGVSEIENIDAKFNKLLSNSEKNFIVHETTTSSPLWIIYIDTYYNGIDTELSYEFIELSWGQWFAYESISTLITHLHDTWEINSLIAETQSKNSSSIKLLEKLGFEFQEEIERHGEEQSVYKKS